MDRTSDIPLPPGQRRVDGFPRFGTHLHQPPPAVPRDPAVTITGAGTEPVVVTGAELAVLPRREIAAGFHCVAGWSATDLLWEGVAFKAFYRELIEPRIPSQSPITHVVFGGLDGFESLLSIEDALAEDVLIADRLDGSPLDADHGAPVRLVSPHQYGYISTKHLCRIEVHTSKPTRRLGAATQVSELFLRGPLILRHPRARVWEEERHPYLPAWMLRRLYRLIVSPGVLLCARGSSERPGPPA